MASRSPPAAQDSDRTSRFECALCAENASATTVPYDALGYPIRPSYGFHGRDY